MGCWSWECLRDVYPQVQGTEITGTWSAGDTRHVLGAWGHGGTGPFDTHQRPGAGPRVVASRHVAGAGAGAEGGSR